MKKSSLALAATLAVFSATGAAHAVVLSDFDGGGSAFSVGQFEGGGAIGVTAGGPTANFYTLLSSAATSNRNYIAFDSTDDWSNWTNISFTMDFVAGNVAADGFAVALLGTATHGTTGIIQAGAGIGASVEERANYADSIGVGFRTFNGTNATVSRNGMESADTAYNLTAGQWGSLKINVDRNPVSKNVLLDVTVYDAAGQAGTAQDVYTDYALNAVSLEDFRVQVTGRTGGSAMDLSVDNIEIDVTVFQTNDTDGDGLPDVWETEYGLDENDNGLDPNNNGVTGDPNNGAAGDPDMDTLSNEDEFVLGTSPILADTDMDGLDDNVEDLTGIYAGPTNTGTNPIVPDTDGDGLKDGVEDPGLPFVDINQPGTDPNKPDTDGDEINDLDEILLGRNPTVQDSLTAAPPLLADFDGNGDNYVVAAVRSAPKGFVVPGGPSGNYYKLLNNVGDAGNYIAFDSTGDFTGWTNAVFQMDFLAGNVQADGIGINFLSTAAHGDTGTVRAGGGDMVEERALIANSFGVGFRTFQATNATVTWNEIDMSGDVAYDLAPDIWASVEIEIDRDPASKDALVDVTLFDQAGQAGNAQNVFTDFAISNFDMEDFRAQVSGRTGGAAMDFCIDNVKLIVGNGFDPDFRIVSIERQFVPGDGMGTDDSYSVTVTWKSQDTRDYKIYASQDMRDELGLWEELEDTWPGETGETTTSYTEFGVSLDTERRFYTIGIATP